jgi:hypothetical protein
MKRQGIEFIAILVATLLLTGCGKGSGRRMGMMGGPIGGMTSGFGDSGANNASADVPMQTTPINDSGMRKITDDSPAALWESRVSGSEGWTASLADSIHRNGAHLIASNPSDIETFCPRYNSLSAEQRVSVWVRIISGMAYHESGFRPAATHTEKGGDVSRGLLQISVASGNDYGCSFASADTVHDPAQNLNCGVMILNKWVVEDGRLAGIRPGQWRGGARYWAVLRNDRTTADIRSYTQQLPICN